MDHNLFLHEHRRLQVGVRARRYRRQQVQYSHHTPVHVSQLEASGGISNAYSIPDSLAAALQFFMYGGFTPADGIFAALTSRGMLGALMSSPRRYSRQWLPRWSGHAAWDADQGAGRY